LNVITLVASGLSAAAAAARNTAAAMPLQKKPSQKRTHAVYTISCETEKRL
jgi:hypothetical protein